ncbi:extracellular solute-binding protein [Devosia ginsengisoli]|uniref:Extracellular solute-binding protein n=1 Tax=Devosia ginsengisoli TaxID=400770 RepID=A0A5B8LY21_9HYPH|nr:extracellular solute-binding protein [Devosia ginsengisoli]QDZ12584.1 extracellular solute-binding protein [Devosia ginsengisoli]
MSFKHLLAAGTALAAITGLGGAALAQDEPVTITIINHESPRIEEQLARIEAAMAEKGINIDINQIGLPNAGYPDALSLRLLSGEVPDIIYFQGGDAEFAAQGILEDLRPWIAQSTYLKDALWPHNEVRLENYPYLLYVFPARTKSPVIRKDWLEQTGLAAPTSLDEWTEFLRVLSDSDYDGNGTQDTYGIIAPDNTAELDAIFNQSFGISSTWLADGNGEWIHSRVSDGEREKLEYYRMLYADGILDREFITSNWEIKEDKFYTGRVAIVAGTAGSVVDTYRTKMQQVHPDSELALLEPPDGLEAVNIAKEERGFAIHAMSDNKEAAFAFLDFMASPEGLMIDSMGYEGEHYTRDGDTYEVLPEMGLWYPRYWTVNPEYWTPPVDLLSSVAQASLEQGARYFTPDNAFVWPGELAANVDAAEQYYRSSVYRFVSGEWSMDQWDAYVQGWYDNGGQAMTDYARTVLDD